MLVAYGYKNKIFSLAYPDSSKINWIIQKVSWAPSQRYNLLSIIPLAKKGVEVFFQQSQVPSEFHHLGKLFEIADIINNQYIICTIGYFSNSTLNQKTINAVTLISIQSWHCQIGHLDYQNIFWLPQVADGIDIGGFISVELCENFYCYF